MNYDYDYNTNRKNLVLPEYGRNIQKMVLHLLSIEDREERNLAAQTVIQVMGNMNPHLRDVSDFKHKLWDHLAIISELELDIDAPYPLPTAEELAEKPNRVPYKSNRIKYKHYGKSIELFIEWALQLEEGDEKDTVVNIIANHMKKSFLTWNREVVSDEQIIEDMIELSDGRLKVNLDKINLAETRDILSINKNKTKNKKQMHRKR